MMLKALLSAFFFALKAKRRKGDKEV